MDAGKVTTLTLLDLFAAFDNIGAAFKKHLKTQLSDLAFPP